VTRGRAARANTQVNFSPSIHIFYFINIISGYPIFAYHQNMSPYNPVGHFIGIACCDTHGGIKAAGQPAADEVITAALIHAMPCERNRICTTHRHDSISAIRLPII
jgi:hypothetical protein